MVSFLLKNPPISPRETVPYILSKITHDINDFEGPKHPTKPVCQHFGAIWIVRVNNHRFVLDTHAAHARLYLVYFNSTWFSTRSASNIVKITMAQTMARHINQQCPVSCRSHLRCAESPNKINILHKITLSAGCMPCICWCEKLRKKCTETREWGKKMIQTTGKLQRSKSRSVWCAGLHLTRA